MNGKNHSDEPGKGGVNREIKANEATRVIDDPSLPLQPAPIPRQPVASPATTPSDVVQGQQKFSVQEQTRIEKSAADEIHRRLCGGGIVCLRQQEADATHRGVTC